MRSELFLFFATLLHVDLISAFRVTKKTVASSLLEDATDSSGRHKERKQMDLNIGQCINPEDPSILTYSARGEEKWYEAWDELVWNKMEDTSFSVDAWANHPFGDPKMPWHMIIGLLQDDSKYTTEPPDHGNVGLDSECFAFPYDDASAPDPAGCRPFKASFKPLQTLRSCIVKHLDTDPKWTSRFEALLPSENKSEMLDYMSWCSQSVWATLNYPGTRIEMQKNVLCNPVFDSKRRALEMMKFVLYKLEELNPSGHADFDKLKAEVIKKIHFTITWKRGAESLEPSTSEAIATECFHMEKKSETNELNPEKLREARLLWSIRKCIPAMFDKAEIAGHGVSDAIVKFQGLVKDGSKAYYQYFGNPKQELHQMNKMPVAPMCARLALASIPNFADAKYEIATLETISNDRFPAFYRCLDVHSTNCRKAYFCWESALNRVCGIHPKCCPGKGSDALETHKDCSSNPDGKLFNVGGTRLMPTGEAFGRKGKCRTDLGTGS